jgi:hypothetical protein
MSVGPRNFALGLFILLPFSTTRIKTTATEGLLDLVGGGFFRNAEDVVELRVHWGSLDLLPVKVASSVPPHNIRGAPPA